MYSQLLVREDSGAKVTKSKTTLDVITSLGEIKILSGSEILTTSSYLKTIDKQVFMI
jgi:hypothetical protein